MEFPTEIWNEIFVLACTDTGITGRSLSLVSRRLHDISAPYKYQYLAITQWKQLIAFSKTFPHVPKFQRNIKYLYIHCPYPFLYVENNPRLASERVCLHADCERGTIDDSPDSDSDSDSDSDYVESDNDFDSESDGSLDLDEEQEFSDDVHGGSLPTEANAREDNESNGEIQAVFDKALQALHAILNETCSTLNILTVYWTSFRPLQIHDILPPLPLLDELHLFRCSVTDLDELGSLNPPTALFPRLRLFFMSCDKHSNGRPLLDHCVAIVAPNLTHFRCTLFTGYRSDSTQCIDQDFIFTRSTEDRIKTLVSREVDTSEVLIPFMGWVGQLPESWQYLWSSRVAGRSDVWKTSADLEFKSPKVALWEATQCYITSVSDIR